MLNMSSSSSSSAPSAFEGQASECGEILYLVSKFLRSSDLFKGTYDSFNEELVKSEALGKKVCWDGTSKSATLEDWDAKFETLPSNALSIHLKNSLLQLSSSRSIITSSFLEEAKMPEDLTALKAKCQSLVDSLLQLKQVHKNIAKLTRSVNHSQLDVDNLPQQSISVEDHNKCGDVDDDADVHDDDNDDDVVQVDEAGNALVSTLTELGKSKELAHQKRQLADAIVDRRRLESFVRSLTTELGKSRAITESGYLARIGNGAHFASRMRLGPQLRMNYADASYLRATERSICCNYRLLWSCLGHYPYPVYCVAMDRSGRFAITGADDYLVKLWNLDTGDLVYTCRGHLGEISILAVSPDNSVFASACTNGEVRVWRLRDGVCLRVMKHRNSVNWMQFDEDRGALVSTGDDGQCIVWDLARLVPPSGGALPLIDSLIDETDRLNKPTKISRELISSTPTGALPSSDSESDMVQMSTAMNDNIDMKITENVDIDPYAALTTSTAATLFSAQSSFEESAPSSSSASFHLNSPASSSILDGAAWTNYIREGLNSSRGSLYEWSTAAESSNIPLPSLPQPGAVQFAPAVYDPRVANSTITLPENSFLALPHMNDNTHAITDGADIKVNCFDICPLGCVLVTGCEDGVARLWRFADENDMLLRTGLVRKSNRAKELPQMNGLLSPTEIQRLQQVAKYLILRLEGHIRGVTDIHFSNVGDRILTSSTLDGTVRVWAFNREFTKSEHVLLNPMDQESRQQQTLSGLPQGRRGKKTLSVPQVFNACWSTDDLRIITLQAVKRSNAMSSLAALGTNGVVDTPTSLKVWDSMTGDLLTVISPISLFETKTLVPHPREPDVVLIGGKGGHLAVWDWAAERELTRILVPNRKTPDQSLVSIHDAVFSPDGSRIVYTDALGRIIVLGLDRPERFSKVKPEQYFSTEMAPTVHDSSGFAIDVATRLPVHLAPRGPICMQNGTPYDETLPGPLLGPLPGNAGDIRSERAGNKARVTELGRIMERSYATFVRNKLRGRQPRLLRNANTVRDQRHTTSNTPPGASTSAAATAMGASRRYSTVPFDLAQYEPSSDEDDGDSEWERGQDDPELAWAGRGGVPRRERTGRNVINLDDDDDDDDSDTDSDSDDDDTEDGSDQMFGRRRSQRRLRSSRSIGLGRTIGSQRPRRKVRRVRITTSDDEQDEEEEPEVEQDMYDGDEEEVITRPRRSQQKAVKKSNKERKSRNGGAIGRQSALVGRFAGTPGNRVIPVGTFVERQWLQESRQLDYMYVPQVGDRVYYYQQGHQETLQIYPEGTSPPWNSFAAKWCAVDCEVREISYDFPTEAEYYKCPSVVVKLVLALCRVPQPRRGSSSVPFNLEFVEPRTTRHSQQQEHLFTVNIRRCSLPEFVVLKSVVDRSMSEQWYPGKAIQTKFIEESLDSHGNPESVCKLYHGIVLRLSCVSTDFPGSPWDAVEVKWTDDANDQSDDASTDRISPWDAVVESNKIDSLDEAEVARIDSLIAETMDGEEYEAFRTAVDATSIPDYYSTIPMPIWVELIQERLRNNYYRQIPALEHDISQLAKNCVKFNLDCADIVLKANALVNRLLDIVRGNERPTASSSQSSSRGQTKIRLTIRSPTKTRVDHEVAGGSNEDDDDDVPEQFGTRRYSSRAGGRRGLIASDRQAQQETSHPPSTRVRLVLSRSASASSHTADQKRRRSEDVDDKDEENEDDDDDEEEDDDGDDEEDEDDFVSSRSRRGSSRRLAKKKRVSYTEDSYDDDDESDDDNKGIKNASKRGSSHQERSRRHEPLRSTSASTTGRNSRTNGSSSQPPSRATESANTDSTNRRPARLDRDLLTRMNQLVAKIEEGDAGGVFAEPVLEEEAPGYYEIIQQPMDLSTIKSNIANRQYSILREVQEDLLLMFSNCELYNDPNSDLARLARRLKKLVGPL